MYFVHLLRSEVDQSFYIGSTSDLKKRFYQHNQAQNIATKSKVPWDLVYYEAFQTKALAISRERKLKHHGKGLLLLKKRLGLS